MVSPSTKRWKNFSSEKLKSLEEILFSIWTGGISIWEGDAIIVNYREVKINIIPRPPIKLPLIVVSLQKKINAECAQQELTCSKITIETLKHGVKYVQS